jgi:hypothetical protein
MHQESPRYLNRLPVVLRYGAIAQFVLFRFPLKSEPFMNYPG